MRRHGDKWSIVIEIVRTGGVVECGTILHTVANARMAVPRTTYQGQWRAWPLVNDRLTLPSNAGDRE
jgi:hypothetical protein